MEHLLFFLGFVIVASILGWIVPRIRSRLDLKNLPQGNERLKLLEELRTFRARGHNYQWCLNYLKEKGYRAGVAEGLLVDLESEEAPDLRRTQIMNWNGWTCEYPGNWKAILGHEDLPGDFAICLESPGGSHIAFFQHPDLSIEPLLEEHRGILNQVLATDLHNWGHLQGYGEVLKGMQIDYKIPMEITVFQSAVANNLILVQTLLTEEKNLIIAGFDLVESSFKPIAPSS